MARESSGVRGAGEGAAVLGRRDAEGPAGGVLVVAAVAYATVGLAALLRWGTETLVVVPSTLVVTVYVLAAAAGVRLLRGPARLFAALTIALTLLVVPAAARHVLVPLVITAIALLCRYLMVRITLTTRAHGYVIGEGSDDPVKVPAVMGLNEEDRRNARRVLDRHRPDTDRPGGGLMTCEACGQPYPCLPRQIAENTLAEGGQEEATP